VKQETWSCVSVTCDVGISLTLAFTCHPKVQAPHFLRHPATTNLRRRRRYVPGSINEQMIANGGGRTVSQAESLVRVFNLLILVSTILTPPFGRFVDKYGMVPAFLLVNALGIFTYGALLARPDWALYLAFLAFGCFRAWNYSLLTTYVQGVFGGESFGKVYGIGVGMFSIVSATTQYPTMELVGRGARAEAQCVSCVKLREIGRVKLREIGRVKMRVIRT